MVMQFSSLMYDPSEYAKEMRQNYFQQQHHMFLPRFEHSQECFPQFNVMKNGGSVLGNYQQQNNIIDISSFLTNRHHEIRGNDTQVYYKPQQSAYISKSIRPFKEQHQNMPVVFTKPTLYQTIPDCPFFQNKKFYEKY